MAASSLTVFLALAAPQLAHAQSTLQQTTPGVGIQPQSLQSAQAQATTNTQNQVGTLQENKGETVLSQSSSHALGVVSDPTQVRPEIVVQPSSTLSTAPIKKAGAHQKTPIIWVIGLIVLMAGIAYWLGQLYFANRPVTSSTHTAAYVSAEVGVIPKPKKKKRSKKRRTPHQR